MLPGAHTNVSGVPLSLFPLSLAASRTSSRIVHDPLPLWHAIPSPSSLSLLACRGQKNVTQADAAADGGGEEEEEEKNVCLIYLHSSTRTSVSTARFPFPSLKHSPLLILSLLSRSTLSLFFIQYSIPFLESNSIPENWYPRSCTSFSL